MGRRLLLTEKKIVDGVSASISTAWSGLGTSNHLANWMEYQEKMGLTFIDSKNDWPTDFNTPPTRDGVYFDEDGSMIQIPESEPPASKHAAKMVFGEGIRAQAEKHNKPYTLKDQVHSLGKIFEGMPQTNEDYTWKIQGAFRPERSDIDLSVDGEPYDWRLKDEVTDMEKQFLDKQKRHLWFGEHDPNDLIVTSQHEK